MAQLGSKPDQRIVGLIHSKGPYVIFAVYTDCKFHTVTETEGNNNIEVNFVPV